MAKFIYPSKKPTKKEVTVRQDMVRFCLGQLKPSILLSSRLRITTLTLLTPTPPYNFALLLDFLRRWRHPSLDHVAGSAYRRMMRLDGQWGVVEVQAVGDNLQVALVAGDLPLAQALAPLQTILGTQHPHAAFWTYAPTQATLWQVIAPLYGLPLLGSASLFETLICVIIEQHIAWTTAQRAQQWLMQWGGTSLTVDDQRYYAFPTAEQLATATLEELTPLKITHQRIRLIMTLAEQVASGALAVDTWPTLPPPVVYERLLAIKGIGPWTATVVLGRALGHYGRYVAQHDVALQAAVNRYFYGGTGRVAPSVVQACFEPFGEYAGLAAMYTLCRWVLDNYAVQS